MSYIGNPIISTDFPKDTFSGNGSTTAFTMSIAPASVNSVLVIVSGITQSTETYTISGTTLTFSAAPPTGTDNILVRHLGVAGTPNVPSDASVTSAKLADANVTYSKLSSDLQRSGMKNRIINGAMVIDQRNAGASVTPTNGQFTLDRWKAQLTQASKFSVQQSSTAPTGFVNSLLVTSLSSYSVASGDAFVVNQNIEGYNIADLGWGTASAKTVTVSFQVRSSLTGTFGASIRDSNGTYSYPFTYTISSANTWTAISVTIAGPTSGTWLTTNGSGLELDIGLGVGTTYSGTAGSWSANAYFSATGATSVVGTSGATFYITGVQLEVGSSATGFEYRIYSTELQNCQRYFEKSYNQNEAVGASGVTAFRVSVVGFAGNEYATSSYFKVSKRTAPTMAYYTNGGAANSWVALPAAASRTPVTNSVGENSFEVYVVGVTTDSTLQGSWTASAEL